MSQFWINLQPRERLVLVAGTAIVLLLLVYLLIWGPINSEVTRLEKSVAEQQQLLVWMDSAAKEVERLRKSQSVATGRSGQSLLAVVDRTAKAQGLGQQLKRVQPDGERRVRIWLEDVSFDMLVKWLTQLSAKQALHPEGVVIDRADNPGVVNARLVLEASG